MPRRNYATMPADYAVCLHEDCPLAATCLHQIALSELQESEVYLSLINPKKCAKGSNCKFYRDSKPVKYAYGFTGFQKRMFPAQYRTFMNSLIKEFGRNEYFAYRRGSLSLSPKEQETVISALHEAGITEAIPFDRYEEQINYCD